MKLQIYSYVSSVLVLDINGEVKVKIRNNIAFMIIWSGGEIILL